MIKQLLCRTWGIAFVTAIASCSAGGTSEVSGAGGAGAGAGGTIGMGGTAGSGGTMNLDGGCSEGNHCSADLHSLLDCNGNVVMTCPENQGCMNGSCGGACESAEHNKTSVGCEYYSVDPDITFDGKGGCFAAFVVNTWSSEVALTVEYAGQSLDPNTFTYIPKGSGPGITYEPISNGMIPAGEVAILFLNRKGVSPMGLNTNCPKGITPAVTTVDAAKHGTGIGSAFHISTSAPVAAYDIYPYGGGMSAMTSATLLLPTTAWGTNYIGVSAFGSGMGLSQPFLEVVAQFDGTSITINPSANIVGGTGVAASPKGTAQTYTLNKGQVLQFTQPATLEGSVIESSLPVGVWGGATSLGIQACCDDSAHQQIPPIRALGSEYVGVRYRNRYDGIEETPPWRMVGAVDGTVLTWEPDVPAGAPTSLALGQVAQFNAAGPFVVRSQDADHPFYMSAHMTGGGVYDPQTADPNAKGDGRGDAEFVNVIPPGEYLEKYIFFADPTYAETDIVIVRSKGPQGFVDVNLDCAGALTGWQPVGTSGLYEYTRFDLVRHNFEPQGGCDNGRHEISSLQPFGLTVWGWGSAETGAQGIGFYTQYVSYAYPGGAGVEAINTVVVPPVK
ncbi:MAG: IgGFc-binding protein [Deltaproteobacteria bacterium]|nr:IgGFc-binding protein [Deltaproteobacteria bacterium]